MSDTKKQNIDNKLVLIGDSKVGKTSLISRFVCGLFDQNMTSTDGVSYAIKKIEYKHLNITLDLNIWDTAGQEKYKPLTKFLYKDAPMIILVYDTTSKESFDNLKYYWYEKIKENIEGNEEDIVFGIAGNKSDLYDNEEVPEEEARNFAKSINAIFALTSAKDNDGIEELFRNIGNKYLELNFQEKVSETQKENFPNIEIQKEEHF